MFSLSKLTRAKKLFGNLVRDRRGNIALTFALTAVPLLAAVGASVDFARAYNTQSKMQSDLDAALLAAVQQINNLEKDALEENIRNWFAAQASLNDALEVDTPSEEEDEGGDDSDGNITQTSNSGYNITNIHISKEAATISASVTAYVPTTFMNLVNVERVPVTATSAVAGPASSYIEVHIVLDKSPSMLLAANTDDQEEMRNDRLVSCEFACHDNNEPVYDGRWKKADNYYEYMKKEHTVELRADVANTAAKQVVSFIKNSSIAANHVKIALYKIGQDATQVLAPTSDFDTINQYLDGDQYGLTSATSEEASYFDIAVPRLKDQVGSAGDGSTAEKPLKLVLMLTDGVQSERNWVLWWLQPSYNKTGWSSRQGDGFKRKVQTLIAPMNPDWCGGLKDNGVQMGVLYTEYLPITRDWGYNETIGEKMSTSGFKKYWDGEMRKNIPTSISRRDYIPYALEDCASSKNLFLSANHPEDIKNGLTELFSNYIARVRLTQ